MADEMRVDVASVRRSFKASGYHEFWVLLRTDSRDVRALADALARVVERRDVGVELGGDGADFRGVFLTPNGYAGLVSDVESVEHLDAWMALVAEQLTAAGFTGVIEGVRSASPPSWWPSPRGVVRYTPTVYIAWSFDRDAVAADEQRESHWHVPPDVTPTIVEHAARWAESGGDRALVDAGFFSFQARPPFTDVMCATLAYESSAGVLCYRSDARWSRHARLEPQGDLVMQEIGATNDWRARIDSMRAAIVEHARLADLGFVRTASAGARYWAGLRELPGLHESDVRYNKQFLDRYVPDAHGIQVLTGAHLAAARDLSRWLVTDLGHDRYLVEAADLTAWFATERPDPMTVEQARADFGPMILTRETIALNPPPWRPPGRDPWSQYLPS
jgi:hypothetical protein